jgi:N utilization substance protein B
MTATPSSEPASDEFRARRRAREAALQILYFCEVGHASADEAIAAHAENDQATRLESPQAQDFAARLVTGTVSHAGEIDPVVAASAEHWRPERMAIIDRLILRMAVYQMRYMPDVPSSVVINEAIELARRVGGEESGRFVNGVLDAVKRKLEAAAGPQ